jgi:putative FmdB family regulatory protein
MPIYEYECTGCGCVEEVIQKFSDQSPKSCPHCSGKLQKLISHSSFHLKGTGWYATDYKSGKSSPSSQKKEDSPGTDTKASEKATEKSS